MTYNLINTLETATKDYYQKKDRQAAQQAIKKAVSEKAAKQQARKLLENDARKWIKKRLKSPDLIQAAREGKTEWAILSIGSYFNFTYSNLSEEQQFIYEELKRMKLNPIIKEEPGSAQGSTNEYDYTCIFITWTKK